MRADGYVSIKLDGEKYYAHRLVWVVEKGEIPDGFEVDHIDHNPSNNKIENLRLVTSQGNRMNSSIGIRNKSGHIGVFWSKKDKKWMAQIRKNSTTKHLGSFDVLADAVAARTFANKLLGFHENHGVTK